MKQLTYDDVFTDAYKPKEPKPNEVKLFQESIQQLIQQVDERIVEADTNINQLNVLTEQYNQQEIEEILKIMKRMDEEI